MRRLSGLDAAFLYGETASWHMHVSGVVIMDPSGVPDFGVEKLRSQLRERLPLVPQFRERILEVPFGIDRPVAVEDPNFDLDYHVRTIGCPAPGTPQDFGALIGDLVSYKLDRNHPLWEIWLIEGLEGGRVGMLAKIHHSIIDGVSGSELATVLLDIEPNPSQPTPEPVEPSGEPIPEPADLFLRGMFKLMVAPMNLPKLSQQLARQANTMVRHLTGDNAPAAPFSAPMTMLNRRITPHRRFAYTSLALADMKTVKNAFGVKLNDVVLAVCAGALREYLRNLGELPPEPMVAQVPVSLRNESERSDVGNKVGNMFASLATDIADPVERLQAIAAGTRDAKEMQQALAADKIMNLTDTTPPGLISLAAQTFTAAGLEGNTKPVFNLIISNVPGPPFDLYSIGAKVDAVIPMGPLVFGTGLNITVISNATNMDFGFLSCRENEADGWEIAERLGVALDELLAEAAKLEAKPPAKKRSTKRKAKKPAKKSTKKVAKTAAKKAPEKTATKKAATAKKAPTKKKATSKRAPAKKTANTAAAKKKSPPKKTPEKKANS